MKLSHKVAIITGGGQGIGRGIAVRLALEGAKVVIAQRHRGPAKSTVEHIHALGGTAMAVPTDLCRPTQVLSLVKTTLEHFGGIDILVNNAGRAGRNGPFLKLNLTAWNAVIGVNLTAVFLCSQATARAMVERRIKGRIINIGSLDSYVAEREAAAYAASKGGLLLLTKAMAVDLAKYQILVNCIIPGSIRVERNVSFLERKPVKEALRKAIPLGHPAEPADIAGAAVFLASDDSTFMTGSALVVDGGYLAYARVE